MTRTLILASTSRFRGEMLRRLQLPFTQVDPGVDEDPWKDKGLPPRELVVELAVAKARAIADEHEDALILGGDQVAFLDGAVLGKPGTPEGARAQLRTMAGRTHELITGTALLDTRTGDVHTALEVHHMTMRALTDAQIADYVARENPVDAAGSYYIESLGIALFESVRGDDFTAIVGLPLSQVVALLGAVGVDVLGAG